MIYHVDASWRGEEGAFGGDEWCRFWELFGFCDGRAIDVHADDAVVGCCEQHGAYCAFSSNGAEPGSVL